MSRPACMACGVIMDLGEPWEAWTMPDGLRFTKCPDCDYPPFDAAAYTAEVAAGLYAEMEADRKAREDAAELARLKAERKPRAPRITSVYKELKRKG